MSCPKLIRLIISEPDIVLKCDEKCTIGRALDCTHVIESIEISRTHCIIENEFKNYLLMWYITDQSANGTILNTRKLEKGVRCQIKNGDIIKLSDCYKYKFVLYDDVMEQSTVLLDVNEEEMLAFAEDLIEQERLNPISIETNVFDHNESVIIVNESLCDTAVSKTTINLVENNSINKPDSSSGTTAKKCFTHGTTGTSVKIETSGVSDNLIGTSTKCVQPKPSTSSDNNAELEDEVTCSICTELFINAVTLNCSHCFCSFCINQWKKNQQICPICRTPITHQQHTRVLDNIVDKLVDALSLDERKKREEQISARGKPSTLEVPKQSPQSSSRGRRERNRAHSNREQTTARLSLAETIELSSDEPDSDMDADSFYFGSEGEYGYNEHFSGYDGMRGHYFGGYGSCYICHQPGHWANGCPLRAAGRRF